MKLSSVFATVALALCVSAEGLSNGLSHRARHFELAKRTPKLLKRKSCKPRSTTNEKDNTSKSSTPKAASTPAVNTVSTAAKGIISVQSTCGAIGATKTTSKTSGPNGSMDWLNCGLNGGGWNPPFVKITDLITEDLATALKSPNSPFQACKAYISLFEQYGKEFSIPPIMLA